MKNDPYTLPVDWDEVLRLRHEEKEKRLKEERGVEWIAQRDASRRINETMKKMGRVDAIRNRDYHRQMEIAKYCVDEWLHHDFPTPGLWNFFQAYYWFNSLTAKLVRYKRLEEAKYYLDYYFDREWDKRFFDTRRAANEKMRKRLARVNAILEKTKA